MPGDEHRAPLVSNHAINGREHGQFTGIDAFAVAGLKDKLLLESNHRVRTVAGLPGVAELAELFMLRQGAGKRADINANHVGTAQGGEVEWVVGVEIPRDSFRVCAGLHDAVVESIEQDSCTLTLIMDARGAFGGFTGRRVRLLFRGVRHRVPTRGIVGRFWLYEEPHLCSRARFSLHILFNQGEMEIEADELSIQRL